MNKLLKCALGFFTAFALSFACFSNALTLVPDYQTDFSFYHRNGSNSPVDISPSVSGITCVEIDGQGNSNYYIDDGNDRYYFTNPRQIYCSNSMNLSLYINSTYYYRFFFSEDLFRQFFPNFTSMQCQTEYSLIPISEVTANYCKLNFDLIDPQECPINEGTGAIVRSNLMINDVPYAQNQNINVFIPDFLSWNLSFNDLYTVIEVEGYNADEEYIENVINNEKLTPTNKDIEEMLTGFMTNYFPYLALAIVFLYLARKIFKLFK